jgi:hypothetical protein
MGQSEERRCSRGDKENREAVGSASQHKLGPLSVGKETGSCGKVKVGQGQAHRNASPRFVREVDESPARPLPLIDESPCRPLKSVEKGKGKGKGTEGGRSARGGGEREEVEILTAVTEANKVLRVVVTPIQKLMAHHTKTSLLRLRHRSATPTGKHATESPPSSQHPPPPSSAPTRAGHKRKLSEVEEATPKVAPKPAQKSTTKKDKKPLQRLKERVSGVRYNLRSRR